MTFTPRAYEGIVRDVLTTLTGGTVGESVQVPAFDAPGGGAPLKLTQLPNRPVRRISHLQGVIKGFKKTVDATGKEIRVETEIPYRFTATDFELISTAGDAANLDAIRFREGGRRPAAGSTLTINYYPLQTAPVPLTDLNVGSVVRTMMETFSREMATAYLQLDHIYRSAFLETAEGSALDKVVALVGVTRLPASTPVTKVRFTRRAGTTGQITVPVNTPLVDQKGTRYVTLDSLTLEPGEPAREVLAGGESTATAIVSAGALQPEVVIAGVEQATNSQDAYKLTAPETDEELRRRTRGALHSVARGTVDALRFRLLSIEGVKNVNVVEEPNGVPGEIRLEVAYGNEDTALRETVRRAIDETRPAGIRVLSDEAARKRISVRVHLTLAGAGVSGTELASLQAAVENSLTNYLTRIPPGGAVRKARLTSLVLADARVADAKVILLVDGAEHEELTLASAQVLDVARPFLFPPPLVEEAGGPLPPSTASVSAALPIHLVGDTTLANATAAITLAFETHLRTRGPETPLTFDGVAAAIRDEGRFALVRREALLTIESGERFQQLTDGVGSYTPAKNEALAKGTLDIQLREGGV